MAAKSKPFLRVVLVSIKKKFAGHLTCKIFPKLTINCRNKCRASYLCSASHVTRNAETVFILSTNNSAYYFHSKYRQKTSFQLISNPNIFNEPVSHFELHFGWSFAPLYARLFCWLTTNNATLGKKTGNVSLVGKLFLPFAVICMYISG